MCKRTAIEHGWGCKPPHTAREEELQRRGEGGARGARRRARSEGERGLATQRHNGTGDGACSCASAESKRSDAREVLRGHVRKKHQETDRSKRARALRMVLGARRRGGEVGCGDGAAKAKGSDEGAARVEGDDGSGGHGGRVTGMMLTTERRGWRRLRTVAEAAWEKLWSSWRGKEGEG